MTKRAVWLLAPICTIVLAMMFMYGPTFAEPGAPSPGASTIKLVHLWLVLPALAALVAGAVRSRWLKWLAFAASLPLGLYLGLAGFPSRWTWFILFIALYAFIPADRMAPFDRIGRLNRSDGEGDAN